MQLLLSHNASMLQPNNGGLSPLDLMLLKTPFSTELADLFRSAALLADTVARDSDSGSRRHANRQVGRSSRRWENIAEATNPAQVLHRDTSWVSGSSHEATRTQVLPMSAPILRVSFREYSDYRLHPVLHRIHDRERTAILRQRIVDTGTVRVFVSAPYAGMDREMEAFIESEALVLEEFAASRGVTLEITALSMARVEITDRALLLETSLRMIKESDAIIGFHGLDYTDGHVFHPRKPSTDWVLQAGKQAAETIHEPAKAGAENGESITEIEWTFGCTDASRQYPRPGFFFFAKPSAATLLPAKVAKLREKVKGYDAIASAHHLVQSYLDADEGACMCRDALLEWLKVVLPPEPEQTPSALETECHSRRMRGLAATAMSQWGGSADRLLCKWYRDQTASPICHVADISGAGKSTALATLAVNLRHRQGCTTALVEEGQDHENDDTNGILYHCTGVSPEAATLHNMLSRVVHALCSFRASAGDDGTEVRPPSPTLRADDHGHEDVLTGTYSDAETELIVRFGYLNATARNVNRTRVFTWVLDLQDAIEDHANDLRWLPKLLARNFRVVIAAPCESSLSIRLCQRGCTVQRVPRFTTEGAAVMIAQAARVYNPQVDADIFLSASFAGLGKHLAIARTRWLTTTDPVTGKPYFVDRFTNTTTWVLPTYMTKSSISFERWMLTIDRRTRKDYYICGATRATSWVPPIQTRLAPTSVSLLLAFDPGEASPNGAIYSAIQFPKVASTTARPQAPAGQSYAQIDEPDNSLRRSRYGWVRSTAKTSRGIGIEKHGGVAATIPEQGNSSSSQIHSEPGVEVTVDPLPTAGWTPSYLALAANELLLASRYTAIVTWGSMVSRLASCQSVEGIACVALKRIELDLEQSFPKMLAAWQILVLAYFFVEGVASRLVCDFLKIKGGPTSLRFIHITQVLASLVEENDGILRLRHQFVEVAVHLCYLAHPVDRWAAGAMCLRFGKANWRVVHRQLKPVIEKLRNLSTIFHNISYAELGRQAVQTSMQEFEMLEDQIRSPVSLDASHGALAVCVADHFQYELGHDELVTKLDLTGAVLVGRGAHVIAAGLEKNCFLDTLQMSKCRLDGPGMETMCTAIRTNRLSQVGIVDLRQASLPRRAICALVTIFDKLIEVNLVDCGVTVADTELFRGALLHDGCTIERLDLSGNSIKDQGVGYICKALASNRTITNLALSKCGIQDDGAVALASAVQTHTCLIDLSLNWNRIGDNGGSALVDAAGACSTLAVLTLAHNHIGDDGARRISKALATAKLRVLDLSSNASISFEGIKHLGQALESGTTKLVYDSNSSSTRLIQNERV